MAGAAGRGRQGLGGMMWAKAEGTLGEKNWGGRILHLNMKLITCKYNANDMQTSIGFLWVHSSGALFLGLRIGANLHPVLSPAPVSSLLIISEGELKVSLGKGSKGEAASPGSLGEGEATPRSSDIRKTDTSEPLQGAEWSDFRLS